jgi:hypothetical protein
MFKKFVSVIKSKQFILFVAVGMVSYISKILWTTLFLKFFPMSITYILSLILTFFIGYFAAYYLIFPDKSSVHEVTLLKYALAYSMFLITDYFIVLGLTTFLGKHYVVGITISSGLILFIKFFLYKKKVFI